MDTYSIAEKTDFSHPGTLLHKNDANFSSIVKPMKVAALDYFGVEQNFIAGHVLYNFKGVSEGTEYVQGQSQLKNTPSKLGFLVRDGVLLGEHYAIAVARTLQELYKIPVVALRTNRLSPESTNNRNSQSTPVLNRQYDIWYGKNPDYDNFNLDVVIEKDQFKNKLKEVLQRVVAEAKQKGKPSSENESLPTQNSNAAVDALIRLILIGLPKV